MYALRASSAGFGGPPAPAHIVSSMNTGPRGMNGASPFISAQPERDIDSTPLARPTDSSSLRIAWASEIAPDSDDAQKRFTVIAGTESGKPAASAAQRAMSPIPSCAGFTQPAVMSSTRSSGTPTRSQAQTIVWPSRSSARIWDSAPAQPPPGVGTPPRTNASVMGRSSQPAQAVQPCGGVRDGGGAPGASGPARRELRADRRAPAQDVGRGDAHRRRGAGD